MSDIDLSFVVPAYNEEKNIRPFLEAMRDAVSSRKMRVEIIFVDDGSADRTWEVVSDVASDWESSSIAIRGISFSRNFGKESAMLAGLGQTVGNCVCIIDADLQQPPSTALQMYDLLISSPVYDCVAAYQEERKQGKIIGSMSSAFYGLLGDTSGMEVVPNASDFRVMRRSVVDALLSMPEYHRFSKGLFAWVGFKTLPFAYVPAERNAGESNWGFKKLVSYAWEGLVSFSTAPLKVMTAFGLLSAVAALVMLIVTMIKRIAFGVDVPGYATIVALILFFGGAQLIGMGVLGTYVARTYIESKRRPSFIVRDAVSSEEEATR